MSGKWPPQNRRSSKMRDSAALELLKRMDNRQEYSSMSSRSRVSDNQTVISDLKIDSHQIASRLREYTLENIDDNIVTWENEHLQHVLDEFGYFGRFGRAATKDALMNESVRSTIERSLIKLIHFEDDHERVKYQIHRIKMKIKKIMVHAQ